MNGVLIIDKPSGMTSHDVVNRVRRILGQRSIGHLGTLDPMATGILPLVTGSFTRLAQFYMNSGKTYEGTIRFGFSTDTYDAEGEPTSAPQTVTPSMEELKSLAAKFRGVIEQTPPPFSAKKIQGVPAYKLARKQKEVVLKPVQVEIKEFEILSLEAGRASFRARVASGTYMRSVAHDIGQLLGCGAHLESLRRTSVAEFTLSDAHTLEELEAIVVEIRRRGTPLEARIREPEPTVGREIQRPAAAVEERPFQGRVEADNPPQGFSPSDIVPSREAATEYSPRRKPWVDGELDGAPEGRKNGRSIDPHATNPNATSAEGAPEAFDSLFIHPRKLLPLMPAVTADEPTAARIRSGRTVNLPELSRARQVKVFSGQRDLIAIATRVAGTLFHPKIVLCG